MRKLLIFFFWGGGDFNLVLNVLKDKKGGKPNTHQNSLKVVQNFQNSLDLTDIWRDLNPEERRYTWRQNKPEIHCRLDFFLVSVSLAGMSFKVRYSPRLQNRPLLVQYCNQLPHQPQRTRLLEIKLVTFR